MTKLLSLKEVNKLNIREVKNFYKEYFNPGIAKLNGSFGFGNELAIKAEGIKIFTSNNKIIKDFTGGTGVLNHGHNHPKILKARINFQKQKKMEIHKQYFSKHVAGLAYNLSSILPGDLSMPFFCNSGAEANDGALKLAYKFHNGKRKIILHSDISFHGKLIGAGSVTSADNALSINKSFKFQKINGTDKFKYNNIESVEKLIKKYKKKGESDIYALIVEPFSASRLIGCSNEFLEKLKKICNKEKIILIYDEVYTGWFKTGKLFHFMHGKTVPDIITSSKSFGGGKSSISTYIVSKKIFKKTYGDLASSLLHSTTYSGFGEECATAIEAINISFEENYEEKCENLEKCIKINLEKLYKKYPNIIENFKGCGSHYGIKFKKNFKFLELLLKNFPSNFFSDQLFVDKLIVTALIDFMYRNFRCLCTFTSNAEVFMWISPSLITKNKDINYLFRSLDKTLSKGLNKIILNFIKKQLF